MGNAAGKLNNSAMCDGGYLVPNGIYTTDTQDFDHKVVRKLILSRHLAPFYKGSADPEEEKAEQKPKIHSHSRQNSSGHFKRKTADNISESVEQMWQQQLRKHVECPICFLYYPENTNQTRCCHYPICTECFVQIKRKITDGKITTTSCPYCVESNFGVTYTPPKLCPPPSELSYHTTSSSGTSTPQHPLKPTAGRARSHSAAITKPAVVVVMADDTRPHLVHKLQAELDKTRKKQARSAENMAMIAAASRRASERSQRQVQGHDGGFTGASRTSVMYRPELMAYMAAMRAAGHSDLEEYMIEQAIKQSLEGSNNSGAEQVDAVANDISQMAIDSSSSSSEHQDEPSNADNKQTTAVESSNHSSSEGNNNVAS